MDTEPRQQLGDGWICAGPAPFFHTGNLLDERLATALEPADVDDAQSGDRFALPLALGGGSSGIEACRAIGT